MNFEKLQRILALEIDDGSKRKLVLQELSNDKKVIPNLLEILQSEREEQKELILDMNIELSRAHLYIDDYAVLEKTKSGAPKKEGVTKHFVMDKIAEFYVKYKGKVSHAFNRFN